MFEQLLIYVVVFLAGALAHAVYIHLRLKRIMGG